MEPAQPFTVLTRQPRQCRRQAPLQGLVLQGAAQEAAAAGAVPIHPEMQTLHPSATRCDMMHVTISNHLYLCAPLCPYSRQHTDVKSSHGLKQCSL